MSEWMVSLQSVVPQHGLSRLIGRLADLERPLWLKNALIRLFCKAYDIDLTEANGDGPADWPSFNAFFTRTLEEGARPVANSRYVQPADGVMSQCGRVDDGWLAQAKGRFYTVQALLAGDAQEAAGFDGALSMTTYLSPRDYHRVHMPISGTLTRTRYVPGDLFAVNQRTAASVDSLYARNERLVCFFDTADGELAVILVGAMIVAGIATAWDGRQPPAPGGVIQRDFAPGEGVSLAAGEEIGRFYLGSTVVMLLPGRDLIWQANPGDSVRVNGPLADRSER